jgi:hypothetical protein
MDVGLEETCIFSLCALVGHFAYKNKSNPLFADWMELHWVPLLRYVPKFITLTYGWFSLVFKMPEDVEVILGSFLDFVGGSLMLKHWRTGFDPAKEYFSCRHVWVCLPSLSLNLWNHSALTAIQNLLGRFLKVEESLLGTTDKRMAQVLVDIDVSIGLMETMEIE